MKMTLEEIAENFSAAMVQINPDPIHLWFELSYAQYLTIPRSVLQSMPYEWQQRFVQCLEELDSALDWRPDSGRYWVRLKDENGRYVHDPLMDYQRGRRDLRGEGYEISPTSVSLESEKK